jgi:hypothetical protein
VARVGNIKNLKPFKKGQSGNPKGRPKSLPKLEKLIIEILGEEEDGESSAKAIIKALTKKAEKGDIRAAELLLERAYGKTKTEIDLTSKGEGINIPVVSWVDNGDKAKS